MNVDNKITIIKYRNESDIYILVNNRIDISFVKFHCFGFMQCIYTVFLVFKSYLKGLKSVSFSRQIEIDNQIALTENDIDRLKRFIADRESESKN